MQERTDEKLRAIAFRYGSQCRKDGLEFTIPCCTSSEVASSEVASSEVTSSEVATYQLFAAFIRCCLMRSAWLPCVELVHIQCADPPYAAGPQVRQTAICTLWQLPLLRQQLSDRLQQRQSQLQCQDTKSAMSCRRRLGDRYKRDSQLAWGRISLKVLLANGASCPWGIGHMSNKSAYQSLKWYCQDNTPSPHLASDPTETTDGGWHQQRLAAWHISWDPFGCILGSQS